ncbi:MAG TPA: RNA polymerase sigma factor [Verrucomicrobiota bacterium]|nr:RNA polymerase sigma factor [Verrucomicrobiota bacterium]
MLAVIEREKLPVADARAGSSEAWDVLFQRYQLPLYAYVFELVHAEQPSLDIVQETFIAATRHIQSLRDEDRFGSWLFGIAHQKCIQHWRRNGREEPLDADFAETWHSTDEDPSELLVREEQEAEFMKILHHLPPAQREALLLHFVEDFSLDEIARITNTSPGTVKSRLHYAKKTLRKLLQDPTS